MSVIDRVLAMAVLAWCVAPAPAVAQTDAPKAAPVAPPSAPAPSSATTTEAVTGAAAWDRLKGNTITGKVGGQVFSEYFDAAGSVRYVDKDGLSTGTWSVQNTKVCFDFPDDDDRSCSTFTVTGTTGTALDDDNTTSRFEILPGNSKGL